MRIACHQPNFFPYRGFFQKMEEVDLFVILTHCQFEKNNYQNRFNIGDDWYTMSVNRGLEPIKDKKYYQPNPDWNKIKYKLNEYQDILGLFDNSISNDLLWTNDSIIKIICKVLDIRTEIKYDYPTELKATDRLIDICKTYGATEYLSGISGKNYLDLDKFKEAGIKVIFQDESKIIKKPILQCL